MATKFKFGDKVTVTAKNSNFISLKCVVISMDHYNGQKPKDPMDVLVRDEMDDAYEFKPTELKAGWSKKRKK